MLVEKKVAIVSSITDDTGMKNKGMKNLSMNVSPSSSNGKEENTTNEEESDNLVWNPYFTRRSETGKTARTKENVETSYFD